MKGEPLPPPLPPASRTVGQVVAEAIALYRSNFAWALALGLPVALADQVLSTGSIVARIALLAAASPAFSLAYAGACAIRQDEVPPLRTWVVALAVGVVTFFPAAFFFGWFLIVAILWLGLAGHAVPAVMAERLGVVGALRRTFQLARDPVRTHAERARAAAAQPGGRDGADGDLPRGRGSLAAPLPRRGHRLRRSRGTCRADPRGSP